MYMKNLSLSEYNLKIQILFDITSYVILFLTWKVVRVLQNTYYIMYFFFR
jgi:hypothetical protein